jgi:hypothetical protein
VNKTNWRKKNVINKKIIGYEGFLKDKENKVIKKEDVMELHETIIKIEKRQEKLLSLAYNIVEELKGMDEMLEILKNDYKNLKEKGE